MSWKTTTLKSSKNLSTIKSYTNIISADVHVYVPNQLILKNIFIHFDNNATDTFTIFIYFEWNIFLEFSPTRKFLFDFSSVTETDTFRFTFKNSRRCCYGNNQYLHIYDDNKNIRHYLSILGKIIVKYKFLKNIFTKRININVSTFDVKTH